MCGLHVLFSAGYYLSLVIFGNASQGFFNCVIFLFLREKWRNRIYQYLQSQFNKVFVFLPRRSASVSASGYCLVGKIPPPPPGVLGYRDGWVGWPPIPAFWATRHPPLGGGGGALLLGLGFVKGSEICWFGRAILHPFGFSLCLNMFKACFPLCAENSVLVYLHQGHSSHSGV